MWNYDANLPSAKDRVRLAVGDTDATNPLREDETINVTVLAYGEAEGSARLAESLAAQFAQEPDSVAVDGLTVSWRSRVSAWLELATRMRSQAAADALVTTARTQSRAAMRETVDTLDEYGRPVEWWPYL